MATQTPHTLPAHLARTLSIDLEIYPPTGALTKAAALRPDTGRSLAFQGPLIPAQAAALEELAQGAATLTGHNIARFDLPHLRAMAPNLKLLDLPVLDTLQLNPLAFPRYPYHALVKHYQDGGLIRSTTNDPLLDCQLSLDALAAQHHQLSLKTHRHLLTAWHWLCTQDGSPAYDTLFAGVRQAPAPTPTEAQNALLDYLADRACLDAVTAAIDDAESHPWELAYATAWISAAGSDSSLPPWVAHSHPATPPLLRALRDTSCGQTSCQWCDQHNNASSELKRWFGFDSFRPLPADDDGTPLQERITAQALAGTHTLGVLPTGTGKSVCYQLPALSRHYKTGALTIVISPLVALMADQIAGLEARGIGVAVTVNSLLSMPERRDALDAIRLGKAALALVSPETLRSPAFRRAAEQRQIGAFILDEAHCLSKWGHDFRPDYRYIGRFIRRLMPEADPPPILCLTATAKPEVKQDIHDYFQQSLGIQLTETDGGTQRLNLLFDVLPTTPTNKDQHLRHVLETYMPNGTGGAIVYCATRRAAEQTAEMLTQHGVHAGHFHGGLTPERKKQAQDDFIAEKTRAICATNAFGMGIDKPDIRLVIHADIPSSLENYIQEAGRAGRDQEQAHCILLYHQDDTEKQHSLQARNRLSQKDIGAMLAALKKLEHANNRHLPPGEDPPHMVATPGEILLQDENGDFDAHQENQDDKARTALAWLEESGILLRHENRVNVFPSSVRVKDMPEARTRISQQSNLNLRYQGQLLQIVHQVMNTEPDRGISTDQLTHLTGLPHNQLRRALTDLNTAGILRDDTALTAYVHQAVQNSSAERLARATATEQALLELLQEHAPDQHNPQIENQTQTLHLRQAAQQLRDQGHQALPVNLQRMLRSLASSPGRSQGAPISVRQHQQETLRITLRAPWSQIIQEAALRRAAAQTALTHLLSKLPTGIRGADLLAATTMGELTQALQSRHHLQEPSGYPDLLQQALLWLNGQDVIRLDKGLSILRFAMTLELIERNRRFTQADYQPLDLHYAEQTFQVHIMAEYAEHGLKNVSNALAFALDYFTMPKDQFTARWMAGRARELQRRTTPESYRRIVEDLNNTVQRQIVSQGTPDNNTLLLAGPGSGKTRVLVHRIAYLVRVRREDPRTIIALAYNRHAAAQIRARLRDLIGNEASQITVLTCHALAMRLTGRTYESHSAQTGSQTQDQFKDILAEATRYLSGQGASPGEEDTLRQRMLSGFDFIFVDEYQDINQETYDLISALAGRNLSPDNADAALNLFAVGDDDQNIYAFQHTSNRFIRRFETDYQAKLAYMTENYRSTAHIIDAANTVIDPAADRLKTDHPITINAGRRREAPGGAWSITDPVSHGRVQIITCPSDPLRQADAALTELQRLAALDPNWDWTKTAVIARRWRPLTPLASLARAKGIPAQFADQDPAVLWQLRETQQLLEWTKANAAPTTPAQALEWLRSRPQNGWTAALAEAIQALADDTANEPLHAAHYREHLAEWARDRRRSQQGLLLTTAHRAKGLEFDHAVILDGHWRQYRPDETPDDLRRLYYVAMTRARQTLTLIDCQEGNPFTQALSSHPAVLTRQHPADAPIPPDAALRHITASLRDVDLGYTGATNDPRTHAALAALKPGDPLILDTSLNPPLLRNQDGTAVGRLSRRLTDKLPTSGAMSAQVHAVALWGRSRDRDPKFRTRPVRDSWEVILPEITIRPPDTTPPPPAHKDP